MAHTKRDRQKLLMRVRKLKGQIESVERALTEDLDCSDVLHRIAACRGALGGLMLEVLEGHIREHVIEDRKRASPEQIEAADDIVRVLRTYLK